MLRSPVEWSFPLPGKATEMHWKQHWTVGILLFDHVDLINMAGPYEVFHLTGYTLLLEKQNPLKESCTNMYYFEDFKIGQE